MSLAGITTRFTVEFCFYFYVRICDMELFKNLLISNYEALEVRAI